MNSDISSISSEEAPDTHVDNSKKALDLNL